MDIYGSLSPLPSTLLGVSVTFYSVYLRVWNNSRSVSLNQALGYYNDPISDPILSWVGSYYLVRITRRWSDNRPYTTSDLVPLAAQLNILKHLRPTRSRTAC